MALQKEMLVTEPEVSPWFLQYVFPANDTVMQTGLKRRDQIDFMRACVPGGMALKPDSAPKLVSIRRPDSIYGYTLDEGDVLFT
ncbi:hypothetical protein PG994_006577 [Apiospora phragmitis]|uniref:Uncharacterized protein n=1 Tax=Apiospora phragmitis TaxID=2905665 RepID=A0ABR1VFE2_9PEZI